MTDAGARDAGVADAGLRDAGAADAALAPAPVDEPDPLPADHRPALQTTLEPRRGVVTGDVVHLRIVATARKGDDVAIPNQSFAPFEAWAKRHHIEHDGDRDRFVFELDLLALEPGDHTIAPVQLRVVTADGTVGTVSTPPFPMRVGSVSGNEPNAKPKPATKPVRVMQDDYTLAWILGALGLMLVTALVTWLVARWWRRRERPLPPPPPPRPPWDVALEKLGALTRDRAHMLEDGRAVELVDRVSDAMREYFGGRFGFEGLESTTDEVLEHLRGAPLSGIALPEIASLLGDCDLVKFAKAEPDEEPCPELLTGAVRIVRATTPIGSAARPTAATVGPTTPPAPPAPPAAGGPSPGGAP